MFCLNQEGRKLLSGPGSDRRRRNTMTFVEWFFEKGRSFTEIKKRFRPKTGPWAHPITLGLNLRLGLPKLLVENAWRAVS